MSVGAVLRWSPQRGHWIVLGCLLGLGIGDGADAAKLVGPYPFAVGDSFVYAYTSTDSVKQGTAAPTVTKQSYSETTTILSAIKYPYPPAAGGSVTAYPYQTVASTTTSAGSFTLKVIEYHNFVTTGKVTDYLLYGYSDVSDLLRPHNITKHLSTIRVYGAPFVLNELPEKAGARYPEPIAMSETIDNHYVTSQGTSNILRSKLARAASGAYADTGEDVDVPYDLVQKANGTGTLTEGPSDAPEIWGFGLPTGSAKGEVIPVQVSDAGKTGTNQVPDWFPGHGAPAQPLSTDSLTNAGLQTVPKNCGKYTGKKANLLKVSFSELGPVDGLTLVLSDDYYVVQGAGLACWIETYTDTKYDARIKGTVTSVETFTSTTALLSETLK